MRLALCRSSLWHCSLQPCRAHSVTDAANTKRCNKNANTHKLAWQQALTGAMHAWSRVAASMLASCDRTKSEGTDDGWPHHLSGALVRERTSRFTICLPPEPSHLCPPCPCEDARFLDNAHHRALQVAHVVPGTIGVTLAARDFVALSTASCL